MLRLRFGDVAKCFCRGQIRTGRLILLRWGRTRDLWTGSPWLVWHFRAGPLRIASESRRGRRRLAASSAGAHSAAFSVIAKLYFTGTGLP